MKLGGIFGENTLLQHLIKTLLEETKHFPIQTIINGVDSFHADVGGLVISEEHKSAIDGCLSQYPDMLFASKKYSDKDSSSPLCFATRYERIKSGFRISFKFESLTSVIAYLIELGAGIGLEKQLYFEFENMAPQLFVGSSDNFRNSTKSAMTHIFTCMDVIAHCRGGNLGAEDILRLKNQAMRGLKYGSFSDEINLELKRVLRVFSMYQAGLFSRLTDKQLLAFAYHKVELQTLFLQVIPQLAGNHLFPQDILFHISSCLTGLDRDKLVDIQGVIVEEHKQKMKL